MARAEIVNILDIGLVHRSSLDAITEACAVAAHEVNTLYCDAIGDAQSPPWDRMTKAQRDGVRAGVRLAINGGSPRQSHELWLQTRGAEGWTYGPVKSFEEKTSPCFVPYDELPEAQRRKDDLFQSVVLAMHKALR